MVAARGVVTHSSGNHGAALAYAAQRRGIPAFVVMPENAAKVKQANVARFGATIRFCAPTQAARERACADVQRETGATLVHPYDDVRVIAGQGTAALELLDDVPDLDAVIAPVGGGGLISGTSIAAKRDAAWHHDLRRGTGGSRRRGARIRFGQGGTAAAPGYDRRRPARNAFRAHAAGDPAPRDAQFRPPARPPSPRPCA